VQRVSFWQVGWLCLGVGLWGCGARSEAASTVGSGPVDPNRVERCNGLDDDGKAGIDDPFRDAEGRYISDQHCGACNRACVPRPDSEVETHCKVIDGLARCSAEVCAPGFAPSRDGHCAPLAERLCLPCTRDEDCGSLIGASCLPIGGESRCSVPCELGCPGGYVCDMTRSACVPMGGSCSCEKGEHYDYACAPDNAMRDAGAPVCVGRSRCDDGVVTRCQVAQESCDELDNDCDGRVDEGFRDSSGVYSIDPAHCGQCGASCLEDTGIDQKLVCGGDPFAPRCVLSCPDALDGIAVGDKLDGDLNIATGCECVVQKLIDLPGPVGREGQFLDENCDGADGIVRESFYVAGDGDDMGPGSPTRPLRTISAAIIRARDSLKGMSKRPHVFVASGSYTETLTLADGVQVHGGYRRDFRALDPAAYLVEVRAPRPASAPGGAALVAIDVGAQPTRIEGMTLRGLDAAGNGAAIGAYLERPSANLVLSGLTLQAGVPSDGSNGIDGAAGDGPSAAAGTGDAPRAAREVGAEHMCMGGPANIVRGGSAGLGRCGATDVSGGVGAAAVCPASGGRQAAGSSGSGLSPGVGGQGGQDAVGPLESSTCPNGICCGLADFTVPTNFEGPRPGQNGGDGRPGSAGAGCSDNFGRFEGTAWATGGGGSGSDGQPGSGGGGGGGGGGGVLNWKAQLCEFADGLGGGGGGGGAGGCGGRGGREGLSGAPSVALLIAEDRGVQLLGNLLVTARGGRGGNGGAGGDGGAGGTGAAGGSLPLTDRTTPTLAAPFPGARGGTGGSGGAGGGGGGGCGGASVGVWFTRTPGANPLPVTMNNRFQSAGGGDAGAGGGGAHSGSRGQQGGAANVRVQN
jgi:hypothetical protein